MISWTRPEERSSSWTSRERAEGMPRSWPLIGNIAGERAKPSRVERVGDCLRISNTENGLQTTIEITLPGTDDAGGALDDHR